MLSVAEGDQPTAPRSIPGALALDPWPIPLTDARAGMWPRGDAIRRPLNVLIAVVSLVLLAPVMALIALGIKLSSPGPVLFRQVRVGVDRRSPIQDAVDWRRKMDYGGRLFTLYKFRTMRVEPAGAAATWATRDDPRVFPLGRVLRRYRLDELPQLFNVVLGDMNIVGPRPEQPDIFVDLRDVIPRYPHRQRVLPGITGLAQISLHYDTCVDDVRRKLTYDFEYIRRQSVLEDLRIMLRTVPSVVLRKNGW